MINWKTILGWMIGVLFIVGAIWIGFRFYKPNYDSMFHPTLKVIEWQYKGHDMLKYTENGYTSICHSPVCRKCYQVFD